MNPIYQRAAYRMGAPMLKQLPTDIQREVAFAGRSNAGKSSALNAITQQKALARVSKTPGRTQLINVFTLTEETALIDLPGYGFAKVSEEQRAIWRRTLPEYFRRRDALQGLMLIMDIRHPLTDHDLGMLELARDADLPVHVLLTKADKLKRGPALSTLQQVKRQLAADYPGTTVQLFSATARVGVDEAHAQLDRWLFAAEQAEKSPDSMGGGDRG